MCASSDMRGESSGFCGLRHQSRRAGAERADGGRKAGALAGDPTGGCCPLGFRRGVGTRFVQNRTLRWTVRKISVFRARSLALGYGLARQITLMGAALV